MAKGLRIFDLESQKDPKKLPQESPELLFPLALLFTFKTAPERKLLNLLWLYPLFCDFELEEQ